MKKMFFPHILIAAFFVVMSGYYFVYAEDVGVGGSVGNVSPAFTVTPSDGVTDPINEGDTITFTATASDINSDAYYLAVCQTDVISEGQPPTCDGGSWAVSGSTSSGSAVTGVTYVTGSGTENIAHGCDSDTNPEECDWFAFVCDNISGGACYPADGSGDQGLATGIVQIDDIPVDAASITVDDENYEFESSGGCSGGQDVCVDITGDEGVNDVADALNTAINANATNCHSILRGGWVHVYANTEGATGNSVTLAEVSDTGNDLTVVAAGGDLDGGDDDGKSSFLINHRPSFSSVDTDDGSSGTIEPGDTVRVSATLADADDGIGGTDQDEVTMVVCADGNTFDFDNPGDGSSTSGCSGGVGTSGEWCRSTTAVPGTHSCNIPSSLTAVPTAHNTYSFEVYVFDEHNFDATDSSDYSYDVEDVAPEWVEYASVDTDLLGDLTAGGTYVHTWNVTYSDDNGYGDITSVYGVMYDSSEVSPSAIGGCPGGVDDETNCYYDSNECSVTSNNGSTQATYECSVTVQYIANSTFGRSSNFWNVNSSGIDETNNTYNDSVSDDIEVPAITGLDVVQTGINYGSLALGATSVEQQTEIENAGNQILDVKIIGTDMCADNEGGTPTCAGVYNIGQEYQEWSHTTAFNYGEGYDLVETATGSTAAGGCADKDIAVATSVAAGSSEILYWLIDIPSSGVTNDSFSGTTTFSSAASTACTDNSGQ